MNSSPDEARERLHHQTLYARTLPEVLTATQALRNWIKAHPEDEWMRDGFEQLSMIQDCLEYEEAERLAKERQTAAPSPAASV